MPEIIPNSNIDINKDQTIDVKELQIALDDGFFDKLSFAQKQQLEIELQQVDSLLEESFCRALTHSYLDAIKRIGTRGNNLIAVDPKDQLIVDLYLKLSQNSNWKYTMITEVEQEKLQEVDYKERKEGKPYSLQWLEGKKREFMSHALFHNGTHEQKASLLKSEIDKIMNLKEPTPEQKEQWITLLIEALLFNKQGKPSIFALKDRALGERENNKLLIQAYQQQIAKDLADLKKLYSEIGESTVMLEYASPKVFLMKKQLHFAQLAEKDFEKIIQLPDNEKEGGFGSGWNTLKREEFLPFVGQANNWYKSDMTAKLAEWSKGGSNINGSELNKYADLYGEVATAGQQNFLYAAQGFQALQRLDYGSWHNIGKGVGNALPFLGEMFYLGPIFRQVGFGAKTITQANKAKKIVLETTNIIARGGTAAALDVPRVANMTAERMLDSFGATFDELGNIKFESIKEGEGFNEAFAKAFGSLWIEMSVEHGLYKAINGAKLAGFKGAEILTGKTIPPQVIAEGLMSRWLKRFAAEFPSAKTSKELLTSLINKRGADAVKKSFQWDGILTEYIEEEVSGRLTNVVTEDRGNRNPFYLSTQREVFETFMTTLIIGAGMKTVQAGNNVENQTSIGQSEKSHEIVSKSIENNGKLSLEEVLSDPTLKPEDCTDEEFKIGMQKTSGDYTNFSIYPTYTKLYLGIKDVPYTNEQEYISLLQEQLINSPMNYLTIQQYIEGPVTKHFSGKPFDQETLNMINFFKKYPEYGQKIEILFEALKNKKFTSLDEYIAVYNKLALLVDAARMPHNPRYQISKEQALAGYQKHLFNANTKVDTKVPTAVDTKVDTKVDTELSTTVDTKKSDYFEGKVSKLGFTEEAALRNNTLWEKENGREKVKARIEFYAREYEIDDNLQLSDQQLDKIWESHVMPGEIGKLTLGELLGKLRVLQEAFGDHPKKSELARLCLEGGFCGFNQRNAKVVMKMKAWFERRTPFKAMISLNAFFIFMTLDRAKSEVMHKAVDVAQKFSESLEAQSAQINALGTEFEAKANLSKDQYDKMVSDYIEFLEMAQKFSNTRVGRAADRYYDGTIDRAINKAKEGKDIMMDTQDMMNQVNLFLSDLQMRTNVSLDMAHKMQHVVEDAHKYLDMGLNAAQIISAIFTARLCFWANGLYHGKSYDAVEQKKMRQWFRKGIASAIAIFAVYMTVIDPKIQVFAQHLMSGMQEIMNEMDKIELLNPPSGGVPPTSE